MPICPYGPDCMIICMPMTICHMSYIPYAHMPISSVLRILKGVMVSSLLMTLKLLLDTYLPYLPYHTYIWESILCPMPNHFHIDFWTDFRWIMAPFLDHFFDEFSYFGSLFRPCFLYRFVIEFRMEFGLILIFFDVFTVRTCNLVNHQKPLFFQ